jgi:peptide/nickel transport system substrate-binding protein
MTGRRTHGLLVAAAIALLPLAACSSSAEVMNASPPTELRIADRWPIRRFLPPENGGYIRDRLLQSCLFDVGHDNELVPSLATALPSQANGTISKDGTTFDYHLRRDVRWQDGVPLNADDVIFTWHAVLNPDNPYGFRVPYSEIRSITKLDPYTIRIKLERPNSSFIPKFFAENWCFAILPKHVYAKFKSFMDIPASVQQPVGSGPYILESWSRDNRAVYKANPHYFGGAPHIDRIADIFMSDTDTVISQLKTGEVDAEFDASPREAVALRDDPKLQVTITPQPTVGTIFFNCDDPVTGNAKLRLVIAYALDRKAMAQEVSFGYYDSVAPQQQAYDWAYDPTAPRPEFDLTRANALLDAAGWPRGANGMRARDGKPLEIVLISSVDGIDPRVDVLIQNQLARVGISVIIKTYDMRVLFAPANEHGPVYGRTFQMGYWTYNFQGDDADLAEEIDCPARTPGGLNVFRLCDSRLDDVNHAALLTFDDAKRRKYYALAQRYLYEDMPWVLMWMEPKIDIYSKRLKNFVGIPGPPSYFHPNEWRLQ